MKFKLLMKTKMLKHKKFHAFKNSVCIYHANINVKMLTLVGILTFMSTINFNEHDKFHTQLG